MSANNGQENETQDLRFNELSISNPENVNNKNCSHCNKPFAEKLCKNCGPINIMEGWTSGNLDVDKFIKDIMYNENENSKHHTYYRFECLEWVPFDRFTDIELIGKSEFSKVYSA